MFLFEKSLTQRHKSADDGARFGRRAGYCAVFALILFVGAIFISCNENGDDEITIPQALRGIWDEVDGYPGYEMEINITATTYTDVTMGYTGNVVNIRETSSDAGYITIQFTEITPFGAAAPDPNHADIGRYYVISYKELIPSTSVDISGAHIEDSDFGVGRIGGKATMQAAETAYTIDNEAFGFYSSFGKRP